MKHGTTVAILVVSSLAVAVHAAPAQSGPAEPLKAVYEKAFDKIEKDYKATCRVELARYARYLDGVMKHLQAQGNLDDLLAVKKEKERFEAEKKVPGKSPADTSFLVKKLQSKYHKSILQAKIDKSKNVVALTKRYVDRLDFLIKKLTSANKIDEALAVKNEITRVKASSPVTSAEYVLADHAAKAMIGRVPASGNTRGSIPCFRCKGTGKITGRCKVCGGRGLCKPCSGSGHRRSGLRGSSVKPACISCKGTGKCRGCSGSGKMKDVCTVCNGSGRVPAPRRAPLSAAVSPPSESPPSEPAPKPDKVISEKRQEIGDYSKRLAALHKRFERGETKKAAFEEVIRDPRKHVNELLTSSVYLVAGHPRRVRVAATLHDARLGGQRLIPYSIEVGKKASKLFWNLKRRDKIVITYGVVYEENLTLFDIRKE